MLNQWYIQKVVLTRAYHLYGGLGHASQKMLNFVSALNSVAGLKLSLVYVKYNINTLSLFNTEMYTDIKLW